MMRRWQHQTGFTMVELMVTIAIVAIISSIAYPSMRLQIIDMRLRDNANLIETTLKQARSDALIYRSDVNVTFSGSDITLNQTGNDNYPQTKNLTNDIKAKPGATLTFTPNKKVNIAKDKAEICIVSDTAPADKYRIITIDKLSNITQRKAETGECV